MTPTDEGHVHVREDVLYYDDGWVHLGNNTGHRIAAQDAALLEIVYRGESSFPLLCERITSLAPEADPMAIVDALRLNLRDPRSILELRAPVPVVTPDVIVCDFSRPGIVSSRALVRELRQHHRVLYLGLDGRVRGPVRQNLSPRASRKAGFHSSWFQFAQWCRGIVRQNTQAVLVLCGQQDPILFGDLVPRLRTMIALDPPWPNRTGIEDLQGQDWVPEDPFPALKGLFYALRFGDPENLGSLRGSAGLDFAALESFALLHATRVAYGMIDQRSPLERLGRQPGTSILAHGFGSAPARRRAALVERSSLLLIADLEYDHKPLVPFVHLIARIPESERAFGEVAVISREGRFRVTLRPDGFSLSPWNRTLQAATVVGAIAFPGLLRGIHTAMEIQSLGIPMVFVPSMQPHPLLERATPAAVLPTSTPRTIAALLRRLADPSDQLPDELLAAQARQLNELSLGNALSTMIEEARQRESPER